MCTSALTIKEAKMTGKLKTSSMEKVKYFLLGVIATAMLLVLLGAGPGGGRYMIASSTTGAGRVMIHAVDMNTGEVKVVSTGINNQLGVPFPSMVGVPFPSMVANP
jgi:hypothetical protein